MVHDEEIPHAEEEVKVDNPPLIWRYFVAPDKKGKNLSDDDYVVQKVMEMNTKIEDAYVFSSGKNMGVFKGVGYPEDIAEYFLLDKLYKVGLYKVGLLMEDFQPIHRAGGVVHILSAFSTGRLFTMEKSLLTERIVVIWRCMAIIAPCRPTRR